MEGNEKRSTYTLSKQEWIEGAAIIGAESHEVAGALFDIHNDERLTEHEAKAKLFRYRGGKKK